MHAESVNPAMKGYTPIDIPTQPFIAAYLKGQFGEKPVMNGSHAICKFFNVMLTRPHNYRKKDYRNGWYNTNIRVYIDQHTFSQRGHLLNETNVHDFNVFLKGMVKWQYHMLMDVFVLTSGSYVKALDIVRDELKIPIEAWSDESMLKDYERYRNQKQKNLQPKCPFDKTPRIRKKSSK